VIKNLGTQHLLNMSCRYVNCSGTQPARNVSVQSHQATTVVHTASLLSTMLPIRWVFIVDLQNCVVLPLPQATYLLFTDVQNWESVIL